MWIFRPSRTPDRSNHQALRIVEHEIPILDTAKFAAIVGIGPKFGYNSVQQLGLRQKKGGVNGNVYQWGTS